MINQLNLKNYFSILVKSTKIAIISLGLNYIFFVGLIKADNMYQQTTLDAWGIVIVLLLCAMTISIIIISGIYFCILKKNRKIASFKYTNILIIANIMYVGLMLVIFPMLYRIHESSISGSEWGSDLLLILIQGGVLIVASIWMLFLGIYSVLISKK